MSADFAADNSDRKSEAGGVVTIDGAAVQRIYKKQTDVNELSIGG